MLLPCPMLISTAGEAQTLNSCGVLARVGGRAELTPSPPSDRRDCRVGCNVCWVKVMLPAAVRLSLAVATCPPTAPSPATSSSSSSSPPSPSFCSVQFLFITSLSRWQVHSSISCSLSSFNDKRSIHLSFPCGR